MAVETTTTRQHPRLRRRLRRHRAGPGPGPAQCGAADAAIAGNHGHALTIPVADLDSATNMTYSILGTANHPHSVTFTPAQLQALKAGQGVTVQSTTDAFHDHAVTATCA